MSSSFTFFFDMAVSPLLAPPSSWRHSRPEEWSHSASMMPSFLFRPVPDVHDLHGWGRQTPTPRFDREMAECLVSFVQGSLTALSSNSPDDDNASPTCEGSPLRGDGS